jgi:hypothetical protein
MTKNKEHNRRYILFGTFIFLYFFVKNTIHNRAIIKIPAYKGPFNSLMIGNRLNLPEKANNVIPIIGNVKIPVTPRMLKNTPNCSKGNKEDSKPIVIHMLIKTNVKILRFIL